MDTVAGHNQDWIMVNVPPLLCYYALLDPFHPGGSGGGWGDCSRVQIVSAMDDPSEPDPALARAPTIHPTSPGSLHPCYRHCPPPLMHPLLHCCGSPPWSEYLLSAQSIHRRRKIPSSHSSRDPLPPSLSASKLFLNIWFQGPS